MISVPRVSLPRCLQRNAARWLTELYELLDDPDATAKHIARAQAKYRHPQVKDTLVEMFHGKCAYCESKITVVTYGAIEHFFPKGTYVDLTFEWRNLLLSCDKCNDAGHKGAGFPLDSNGSPLLLDPSDGTTDPNEHLEFAWDDVAKVASIYGRDVRGRAVETVFDLNGVRGRVELIDHRSKSIKRLFALLRFAQQGDAEAMALLQEAVRPDAEYCAFALVHIRPQLDGLLELQS